MRVTYDMLRGGGKSFYPLELMAATMAHNLRDGDKVITGAGSAVARAACRLAQLTHAPNLTYIAGGSGGVNPELDPLTASSCDFSNLLCEAVLAMSDVVAPIGAGRYDVLFCGGLQVDKFGNLNLSALGDFDKPTLRGPGSAALPLAANFGRTLIFMTDHSPRSFVEKVSFRTAPGFLDGGESWRAAKTAGQIRGDGPVLVISHLAVMDFEPESKALRLMSLNPDVNVEQVKAATRFELIIPENVAETAKPTRDELRILRDLDQNQLLWQ